MSDDKAAGLDRARRGESNTQKQSNSGEPNSQRNGPAVGHVRHNSTNGGGINRPLKGSK